MANMNTEDPDNQQPRPESFTPEQRAGLDTRRADRDRTLDAIYQLESALAAAAPKRESAWRGDVLDALEILDQATADEERNAALPESLLADVARTQPRLRSRVRGLRAQYRQLRETIASIRQELQEPENHTDVADLRQRLAWLLGALRHQRARESDLIYEAYYEAFQRDLIDDVRGLP
jgi:hypothetical protein